MKAKQNTPKVHASYIKAWADGETIQILDKNSNWCDIDFPSWKPNDIYRIKPKDGEIDLESDATYRMQMAAIMLAAGGCWKQGDRIDPSYETEALKRVAQLYDSLETRIKVILSYRDRIDTAIVMRDLHGQDKDCISNPYDRGMYNGMEYIISLIENRDPKYIEVNGDK